MSDQQQFLRWFCFVFACICFAGCRSSNSMTKEAGSGRAHVFQATYDEAWEASLEAVKPATVGKTNKVEGVILFGNYPTASDMVLFGGVLGAWGEVGGVFIRRVDDSRTRIEVVAKERSALDSSIGSAFVPREIYKKIAAKYRMLE